MLEQTVENITAIEAYLLRINDLVSEGIEINRSAEHTKRQQEWEKERARQTKQHEEWKRAINLRIEMAKNRKVLL